MENISLHKHDNKKEEFLNGLTHFIGILLAVTGSIFLLIKETKTENLKGAYVVFGLSMILLFTASTVYHWTNNPLLKRVGRILDHSNIYILIAGSYTPLAFYLGGGLGITLITIEWILTVLGILFTLKFWGRLKVLHVFIYLIMGWMLVLVWDEFTQRVPMEFVHLALLGGVCYTIGVIVYSLKKLPFYHAIWHLFVVMGAMGIFFAIYRNLN